jgi:recombination associated protein RdgC
MFKNLNLYRLGEAALYSDAIEEGLSTFRFTECLATQVQSGGWVPPRGEENGALVEVVGGQWLLRFKLETRMLPGAVVRRKAEERMAKIEEMTGRKPGKKQAREIREDTYMQLLPQAFTKQESMLVWIDPRARLLAIDCGSQPKAEQALTVLFKCVPGLVAVPIATQSSPASSMGLWLEGKAEPGDFYVERECELKAADDTGAAVRYSHHNLDGADVRGHVAAGKVPTRLGLGLDGRIRFTLTDKLQIKKIKFLDGVFDTETEEGDRFDTDTTIATAEMSKVIGDLVQALGGYAS